MRHPLILGASAALALGGCIVVVKAPGRAHRGHGQRPAETARAAEHAPAAEVARAPEAIAVPVRAPSAAASRAALDAAYEWLAANQRADGSFAETDAERRLGAAPVRERAGQLTVGVTGLCALALGRSPEHRAAAERGLAWLRARQDDDTGLIGTRETHDFMYGHGIATLALVEALAEDAPAPERARAQAAVNLILAARNPYAAWRYDLPPIGDNDTSVTGWMLAALDAAREKGLPIDSAALEGGIAWIDEVTDPRTGRVGYDSRGSLSSRTPRNEEFPRDRTETMTAVGLASRVEVQGDEARRDVLASHARLLKRKLPTWDPRAGAVDMYYWFFGTRGMHALGGADWEVWRTSLLAAAVAGQSHVGPDAGSWDPVDPWGYSGGRAYATALMALSVAECIE